MTEPEPPTPSSSVRRRVALLAGVAFVAWLAAAGFLVARGATAARAGAADLQQARVQFDLTALAQPDSDLGLDAPAAEFRRASNALRSPVVAPLRLVPVVGRQIRAAHGLASSTSEVLEQARRLRDELRDRTETGLPAGSARTEFLTWMRDALAETARTLDEVDLGPREALVGPLHQARVDVESNLSEARSAIADAGAAADAALGLFGTESTYLVLAANNAEMRVGSGMFLSVGEMRVEDGRLRVSSFESVEDLQPQTAVDVPDDVDEIWGWSNPGQEWRNLGLTPRFPVNASMATAMWKELGRGTVDGALAVDVALLRLLLDVVGPVAGPDGPIDADNVEELLLHDQYLDIDDRSSNELRREQLAEVAGAVLASLDRPGIDLPRLVEALRAAQGGRHLMVWSGRPEQQAGWEALGVDGSLAPDSVLVGVANIDASKLDPFLGVAVRVTTSEPRASSADGNAVELTVATTVANRTPPGEPLYVVGYDPDATYEGVVVAYLPPWTEAIEVEGGEVVASGRDAGHLVVGIRIAVPRQAEQTVSVTVRAPADAVRSVLLEPGARLPPVWWVAGDEFTDRRRQRVNLYGS